MTYTIWTCCGFEQEDTREDAIGMAVAIMQGDGHSVVAVEGPGGEDLMAEAEEADRRRTAEWLERRRSSPKSIGRVEVAAPGGRWVTGAWVSSVGERDRRMVELRGTYGDGRVRWVPDGA